MFERLCLVVPASCIHCAGTWSFHGAQHAAAVGDAVELKRARPPSTRSVSSSDDEAALQRVLVVLGLTEPRG